MGKFAIWRPKKMNFSIFDRTGSIGSVLEYVEVLFPVSGDSSTQLSETEKQQCTQIDHFNLSSHTLQHISSYQSICIPEGNLHYTNRVYFNWWQASKHAGALIPAGSALEHPQLIPRLKSKDEVTKCFYSSESHWWGFGGEAQRCCCQHSLSGWRHFFFFFFLANLAKVSATCRTRTQETVQPVSATALGEQMERFERGSAERGGPAAECRGFGGCC